MRNVTINNGELDRGDGYRLTFEPGGANARLEIKGALTPTRAAELIEDLTPFAKAKRKRRGVPRAKQSDALPAQAKGDTP